ncbi:MAG: ribosome maturation factor RimM [Eubacteriales bacterium]|nr:ribosome maturation factor RimM [Eubacteriales bacterium]
MKRYIEAGRLNSPHGIKGEVKFACYCDSPEFLSGVKRLYLDEEGTKPLEIVMYRSSIPSIIFKGYEERELASVLNGRTVWFDREDVKLPEGVFYFDDLIGETAYEADTDKQLGTVADVEEVAGNIYYIIQGEKSFRIPAIEQFVVKAYPGEGLYLRIPEGMF